MRKFSLTAFLFSIIIIKAFSQPYGNEWINYNQQYFTIQINQQGIYRISYNTLLNAGIPLGTFDPRSFQLMARGVEQPIIVTNEDSGTFLPGDYIEFFAEKNSGWFDKGFYKDETLQPNDNYSLINDTLTYYLTWNNQLNNKRFTLETDTSFQGHTPAPYFWSNIREDYISSYYAGETNNYGVTDPEFTQAQGWFDAAFALGQSRTKTVLTPHTYHSGPQAQVEIAVAGASNYAGLNNDHHLRIQFAGQNIDTIYEGYKLLRFNRSINASALGSPETSFVFSSVNDINSSVDRNAVVYISLRYPRLFTMDNRHQIMTEIPASEGSKTFIQFSGFGSQENDTVWVYDLDNNRKIPALRHDDYFRALIPDAAELRRCFIISPSSIKNVDKITPVNSSLQEFGRFQNFLDPSVLDTDYLMITHSSLMQAAKSYRDYRNSTGYNVLLADVDQLYHQFAYGIKKHPLALRNFARFTIDHFESAPEKMFLIGKGLNPRAFRRNHNNYAATLLPSMGDPSSDILITAGLSEGELVPAIPTGRLAAKTPEELILYLEKIVQYETAHSQPEEWMKNVLHFGGGSSLGEQAILQNYLRHYEEIITDTLFGGYVRTFLKSSTEPIQINQSDSLKQLINNGVSIMTFFGHAAGIGFDVSIDNPSEYNNYGKYPFIIANSCFAGDIFSTSTSSSEEFVIIQDKGTIGYMGSTSASGAYELNRYTSGFIRKLSGEYYGQPIADNIQDVIREIESPNGYLKNICLLNVLHADPALIINYQEKPDYTLSGQDIFFTPKEVSTEDDSFAVNIISTNIGKAIKDSIMIELVHAFPDGSSESYLRRIAATLFKDTLEILIPMDREKLIGLNHFSVTLNAYNQVDELNMSNNYASTSLLIKSPDVQPVIPYKYAIVPDPQITLKASTGDPFLPERAYLFELDTSADFQNPLKETIISKGGVISWTPAVNLADSMVYFWRVSPDSTYTGSYNWRESSFQYIEGKEGWSQAHFDQFGENHYQYVTYNSDHDRWDFVNNFLSIQAQTGVYPYIPWNQVYLKVNGVVKKTWSCLNDVTHGLIFNVFDPISGEIWYSENQGDNTGPFGNYHCSENPLPGFDFYSHDEQWRDRARAFLDSVPQGHYVMMWNHRNHFAEEFSEELYQAFESIGSANIRNLVNNTPYLIFGRKGDSPGMANEVIGADITSIIQLNDSLQTNWNQGYILSEKIGPAKQWESLHWEKESFEITDTDSVWLQVIGIRNSGECDTLINNIMPQQADIPDLSQHIDAAVYPYLQLKVNMRDDENRTPAQMEKWQVIYQGVTEIALNPGSHFYFAADTLAEGQNLYFSSEIKNISKYPTDSLLINYWVTDKDRNHHPIEYEKTGPLLPGQSLKDTITFSTSGIPGNNKFWVEVNPGREQPEQNHFNNIGNIPFFVAEDKTNPLLEVTFDGNRIMNGDIVSARPLIRIMLTDENQLLELNDTTLIKVFLQKPSEQEPRRIYFQQQGTEQMKFFPASLPDNTCFAEFNPDLSEDGIYRLIVQATDPSSNESGEEDYNITFEVINRSTITEVLNWPNPFSTSTQFVFTLTGSELPTFFRIQIMTITGKVVKEIDLEELGPIRIGRNITSYAWDGTDQFGERLANGVYLYRVITNINDKNIELNPTEAGRFFHKEFGKMYLFR